MKLFKKLAASMMSLLLAVVIFAGCATQTPTNNDTPSNNEDPSPVVTSAFEYPAEAEFTTTLNSSDTMLFLNELLSQAGASGAIETMVRNININFTVDLNCLAGLVQELLDTYLPQIAEQENDGNDSGNIQNIDDSPSEGQEGSLDIAAMIDEIFCGIIRNYLGGEDAQAIVNMMVQNIDLTGTVTVDARMQLSEETDELGLFLSLGIKANVAATCALVNGELNPEDFINPAEEGEEAEDLEMIELPMNLKVNFFFIKDCFYLSADGSISEVTLTLKPIKVQLPEIEEESENEDENNATNAAYIELIDSDYGDKTLYERIIDRVIDMVESSKESINNMLNIVNEFGSLSIPELVGGQVESPEDLGFIGTLLLSNIKVVTKGDYTFYKLSPSIHAKVPTDIYVVFEKDENSELGHLVEISAGMNIFNNLYVALTFNSDFEAIAAPANSLSIHLKELLNLVDFIENIL